MNFFYDILNCFGIAEKNQPCFKVKRTPQEKVMFIYSNLNIISNYIDKHGLPDSKYELNIERKIKKLLVKYKNILKQIGFDENDCSDYRSKKARNKFRFFKPVGKYGSNIDYYACNVFANYAEKFFLKISMKKDNNIKLSSS